MTWSFSITKNEVLVSQTTIAEVAHHLKKICMGKLNIFISDYINTDRYTNLNISSVMNDIDPVLLMFIKQLTSSFSDSRHKLFDIEASDAKKSDISIFCAHFYIMPIMFVVYPSCNTYTEAIPWRRPSLISTK